MSYIAFDLDALNVARDVVRPAIVVALVSCAPPPDCTTPCGVAIYGAVDCSQYARLESDLMRRLPLPNACAAVSGFAAHAIPGRTSVRDGVLVEGWTLCDTREVYMHVDW